MSAAAILVMSAWSYAGATSTTSAPLNKGASVGERARMAQKMQNVHEIEARKAPNDAFDFARRPATRLWRSSYEK
ncbi:hypothetical protein BJY52DRAFT_1285606 [Lactarius psammicola]|nr:hypothetical protein BJY52DRAFT_1285606 [Lactarius psammicola]